MKLPREFSLPLISLILVAIILSLNISLSDSKRLYLKLVLNSTLSLMDGDPAKRVGLVEYRTRPGDNLWNLSRKLGINIDSLISANSIKKVHVVPAGKNIYLPVKDGIFYQPASGDTKAGIASNYLIDEKRLVRIGTYRDFTNFTKTNAYFLAGASFTLAERLEKIGMLFLCPLPPRPAYRFTSLFGYRIHPITKKRSFHSGIDLAAPTGTPVYSSMGGRVTYAGTQTGYGKVIVIHHKKGYKTKYAHLSRIRARAGSKIPAQVAIGNVGKTGRATGSHLHFEVIQGSKPLDPRGLTEFK